MPQARSKQTRSDDPHERLESALDAVQKALADMAAGAEAFSREVLKEIEGWVEQIQKALGAGTASRKPARKAATGKTAATRKKAAPRKKATAKKTTRKKATAKKTTRKKATAKKTTRKKATAPR